MSTVSEATLSCGKRNASPGPNPQTKRRRIDTESSASTNNPKNILANLGLPVGASNTLTQAKLKSVAGLLAPSTNTSRSTSRALKGKKSSAVATVNSSALPATSGTGTATDPVIISDEPANQSPPLVLSAGAKRTTRSQEAHILLDTLPDDPSDVLTQTLRTILKTPTAVPRGRSTVSRDTAVYLANGRFTGTPFLRLLRHLAGPTRRTNPALGLALLKKLVEAMRATESAVSKPAPAGPSSAASTPMPVTPETPSATSFAPPGGSTLHYAEKTFEPSLFSDIDFSAIGLDALSLPTIPEASPIAPTDIAIDPELLALSDHPGYYQNLTTPQNLDNFDLGLAELFNALPPAPDSQTLASASLGISEPLAADPSMDWNALANIPFEELLSTWAPEEPLPATNLPQANFHAFPLPLSTPQPLAVPTTPISAQTIKPQASSSGTMRIPARAEALTLLERARAHKRELEEKLLIAKRQLWGCKIEAGVERNLLEALKKA